MEAEDPWKSHKINGKGRNENKSAICSLGMGTKQSGWLNGKTRSSCRSKGIIKITTSHSYRKLFSSSYFYSPHTQPPEGQPKHLFPGNPCLVIIIRQCFFNIHSVSKRKPVRPKINGNPLQFQRLGFDLKIHISGYDPNMKSFSR